MIKFTNNQKIIYIVILYLPKSAEMWYHVKKIFRKALNIYEKTSDLS